MPKHSPFTALCSQLARLNEPRRADLHVHTTVSDGAYTASQVVAHARQAGLAAVAVTDHDTLAAIPDAVATARSLSHPEIEVVPGVEITTEFGGRELHLLAYFVRSDHAGLNATLDRLCARRRERFRDYLSKLAARGMAIPEDRAKLVEAASPSLGRRHVAGLLVACRFAHTVHDAFHRHLGKLRAEVLPKDLLPIEEAIALVHEAGGVASLAHPPTAYGDDEFRRLRDLGLDALEAVYPWGRSSQTERLREVARRVGLLISGGSDCHGPIPAHRKIGSHAVTTEELERLRERCGCPAVR
jgi:3',5'-nucleoside bisphosphate phosphatase